MKLRAFAIRDSKAEAFMRPFFAVTRGIALRSIVDVVSDPNHEMYKHAEDYTLYEVGEFDDQTGIFVSKVEVISILQAFQKGD